MIPSKNNVVGGRTVRVSQVDFVTYLEGLDEDVGVVKMDIEGGEVAVLESLLARPETLRRIRYIFAETHERKIPETGARVRRLRRAARMMKRPFINLYWH